MFVIDVSYAATATGLLETCIRTVQNCINIMAEYPSVRIGIITYSNAVHLYGHQVCFWELFFLIRPSIVRFCSGIQLGSYRNGRGK
jgi:hypothetical protein